MFREYDEFTVHQYCFFSYVGPKNFSYLDETAVGANNTKICEQVFSLVNV